MISSPADRAEALGLALARLYLDYQGVLRNQVLVPLDAHLDLYRILGRHAEELGDEVDFKRTDLALFDLDAAHRTITCRLVEVKCYTGIRDLSAYNQLKDRIAEQLLQSQQVLATHFDPHRTPGDRPDRLVKTRELVTMLEFYLDRAMRYGIFDDDSAEEARTLLVTLERGYRLAFTRSALVFDLEKEGTEPPDMEHGIEFHRIGRDLVRQLVEVVTSFAAPHDVAADEDDTPLTASLTATLSEKELSIPKLAQAAFVAPARDRHSPSGAEQPVEDFSTTVEELPDSEPSEPQDANDGSMEGEPEPVVYEDHTSKGYQAPPASGTMPPVEEEAHAYERDGMAYDILLGATKSSPQYGLLGEASGRRVALDLNETHTISLFGVQGGGKSYTLGAIAEMATLPIPRVNVLPRPLATIIFHYSSTQGYQPEFTSMVAPNDDEAQLRTLRERYGADPRSLQDVVLLAPEGRLAARRAEYPNVEVRPLRFSAAELQADHWRFLMGAVGNRSTYIRQLNRIMKTHRDDLSLTVIREAIDASRLSDQLKELAHERLDLAAEYIGDGDRLASIVHPGRLVIVDLRDEFIEKDEALGLFVVLLQLFAEVRHHGGPFNKLVVFDEAHKYIDSPDLVAGLVEVVREMRHKGTSILVASQDPPSVPVALIELSSQIILHRFNSPAWLKHVQRANTALGDLTAEKMAHLAPGDAYVWSARATDEAFSKGAVKIRCRPRVTHHGGTTRTAIG